MKVYTYNFIDKKFRSIHGLGGEQEDMSGIYACFFIKREFKSCLTRFLNSSDEINYIDEINHSCLIKIMSGYSQLIIHN